MVRAENGRIYTGLLSAESGTSITLKQDEGYRDFAWRGLRNPQIRRNQHRLIGSMSVYRAAARLQAAA